LVGESKKNEKKNARNRFDRRHRRGSSALTAKQKAQ